MSINANWIEGSRKLPEDGSIVLGWSGATRDTYIVKFSIEPPNWTNAANGEPIPEMITFWMHLPKPPQSKIEK